MRFLALAVLTAAAVEWTMPQPQGLTLPRSGRWELPASQGVIYLGSLENGTKQRCSSERIHP